MLAALSFAAALGVKPPALARIDVDARVLNTVADNFICVTLDWWPSNKCDYGTCAWGQVRARVCARARDAQRGTALRHAFTRSRAASRA